MSNSNPLNPDKIIDYSKDYYGILGLEKGCLPEGKSRSERQECSHILETAYRKAARRAHPDFGGNKDAFIDVVRAKWILEDPLMRRMYESGGTYKPTFVEDGNPFEVDWSKIGTYRPGTSEDTIGFGLFLKISQRAADLGLVPAFYPSDETHNYEWDWVIMPEGDYKIALSLVHDESEVLRLTSGEDIGKSLPFKIYVCIPRKNIYFLRDDSVTVELDDKNSVDINGNLLACSYSDFNLLETTSLEDANEYFAPGGTFETHLQSFRDGTMIEMQKEKDLQALQPIFKSGEELKNIDTEMLKSIMNMRSFTTVMNERAADFLENLPR